MTIQNSISNLPKNQVTKICSKCGGSLPATSEFFSRDKIKKSGIRSVCKTCEKKYRKENAVRIKRYKKNHSKQISEQGKEYRTTNAEKIKEYLSNNVEKQKRRCAKYKKKSALYGIHAHKLEKYEEVRESKTDGFLEVKCAYCGVWFIPTNLQADGRYRAINGEKRGDLRFYCNNSRKGNPGCREACPTYKQNMYPKGFRPATSREVDPWIRQACFSRDNFTCQHCGVGIKNAQLHCHHIKGVKHSPMEQNDISNTITLCKKCHKALHKTPGCGYHDYRCT